MLRVIFLFIVLLHGLIHLLSFVKAFNLSEVEQLPLDISQTVGMIWLFTALLIILLVIFVLLHKKWAWFFAIIAVISSQTLIILAWQDAKYGTLPNIVILIYAIISFASWKFDKQIKQEIDSLLSQSTIPEKQVITEQIISSLPSSVQKWMNQIGIIGKEQIQIVYFKQRGQMKLKPEQIDWVSAEAEQYVTIDKPAFLWKVNVKNMAPLVAVVGRDKFQNGEAAMTIKIESLFPVVDIANNNKVNQSALQRYLLELPLYPFAAFNSYITWEKVDQNSAKATMSYKGVSGSATYYFSDSGELLKISAMRYKDANENAKHIECIGEIKSHSIINGIKLPTKIEITWVLENGPFTWYKLEIDEVTFE